MNKLIQEGNLTGLQETPNNMLSVKIYSRKSNKSEGRSKSIAEQSEHCEQVCDFYGFDPKNTTTYEEEE